MGGRAARLGATDVRDEEVFLRNFSGLVPCSFSTVGRGRLDATSTRDLTSSQVEDRLCPVNVIRRKQGG